MITFANNDSAAHTSTAGTPADGPSGAWDSSLVMMGAAYTTPALDVGEYPYYCAVHPWMEGLVIVTDDHSTATSQPEPEPEPTPTTTSTAANTVENAAGSSTPGCEPDCFIPATITINPGESVTFANNDSAAHTSTSGTPADGPNGIWDSSLVMMGSAYTTPALSEGTYPYFCMVHPWMEGTVIVGEGSATPSQAESSQAQDEAAERIAAAEAAAQAAEQAAKAAEAEAAARIAEAEAAARIAEAEATAKAAEEAAQAAEQESQDRIEAAAVNEKIEISMDFTNDSDVQQSFALIVQIKDSNNTTISLSHVTGMLGAGQTLDQVLSYTPNEAGTYTVEKFLWNNFADPTALTDSKETFSLTVS
jgi:plastocyanin